MADKILLVLEAAVGGSLKHVEQIIEGLREEFSFGLVYSPLRSAEGRAAAARLGRQDIPVYPLPMLRSPHPAADLAAARDIARILRGEDYALLHAHSSKAGLVGRLAAWPVGVPAVYTPHCLPFMMRSPWPLPAVYRSLERLGDRLTAATVLVSAGEKEAAERAGLGKHSRLHLIPNGTDIVGPRQNRDRARARLGLSGEAFLIGVVGRLCPQKGTHLLPRIIKAVAQRMPGVRFVIVGDGEMKEGLRREVRRLGISPAVFMAGRREDAVMLYPAFDLLLQPSLWEGGPYTVLEAMASRVPVVASAIPGCRDAVGDGQTGVLFAPGDPEAAAAAVLRLLANPAERRAMGEAAARRVAAMFSLERSLRDTAALYRSLLQSGG